MSESSEPCNHPQLIVHVTIATLTPAEAMEVAEHLIGVARPLRNTHRAPAVQPLDPRALTKEGGQ